MGAALAAMVCRLTLKSASDDHGLADAADRLDALVEELSRSAQDDEACFGRYRAAASLPKSTPEEKANRSLAMQASLRTAAEVPLLTAKRALEALVLANVPAEHGTKHALSDVEAGRLMLGAAITAVLLNVDVNADMIKDDTVADGLRTSARELRERVELASGDVRRVLINRQ
jgi:formiminotetrahydrofolate cyclodeaminase